MKKKIIYTICIFCILILLKNFAYGATVIKGTPGEQISYFTAYSDASKLSEPLSADAYMKYNYYKANNHKDMLRLPQLSGVFGRGKLTTRFLKYIYRQNVGGNEAYCLDPQLDVATTYVNTGTYTIGTQTLDYSTSGTRKFSEITNEYEKMLIAIYKADFSKLGIYYDIADMGEAASRLGYAVLSDDDQYALKQILIWAYINHTEIFKYVGNNVQYYTNYHYTDDLFKEDIFTAILHSKQLSEEKYKKLDDAYYLDDTYYREGQLYVKAVTKNASIIPQIANELTTCYNKLVQSDNLCDVIVYRPCDANGNTTSTLDGAYQRMLGIYVEGEDIIPDDGKKYAIVDYYDNTYVKRTGFDSYIELTADVACNSISVKTDYICTGYDVYKIDSEYDHMKYLESGATPSNPNNSGTSYTLKLDDARPYNIIVFKYEEKPKYYGVIHNYPNIADTVSGFTKLTGDQATSEDNKSGSYICTGYKIYTSSTGYSTPGVMASSVTGTSYTGTSYTITKSSANYYTVVEYTYIARKYAVIDHYEGTSYIRTNYTDFTSDTAVNYSLPTSSTHRYRYLGYEVYETSSTSSSPTTLASGTASETAGKDTTSYTFTTSNSLLYNVVKFKYEPIPVINVYVRHYTKDSNGTYSLNNGLANSYAIYLQAGTTSYVTKSCNSWKTASYSEFYKLEEGDKLLVDRSRIVMSDGIYYNCVGFKLNGGGLIQDQALHRLVDTTTMTLTNKTTNYYIDYYYDPEDYSNKVESIGNSARLKFITKAADKFNVEQASAAALGTNNSVITSQTAGASENANVAYAPVTENLKPYVVTDKCRVNELKYDINTAGTYTVNSYKVWGVSNSANMANVASVVGTQKSHVYNDSVNMNLKQTGTLEKNICDTIFKVAEISNVFVGNASDANTTLKNILNVVSSGKLSEASYKDSTRFNVPVDKYNGERQPTGNILYKKYTVTAGGFTSSSADNNYNISATNSMKVNIYTPVQIGNIKINTGEFVNHSNHDDAAVIQQGVTFSITVSTKKNTQYPGTLYNAITNTGKYVKYWYLMFDFDVTYNGTTYTANSPIRVNAGNDAYATTTISNLKAITNSTEKQVVQSTLNNIKAIAVTENIDETNDNAYAKGKLALTTADKSDSTNSNIRIDNDNIKMSTTADLGLSNASYYLVSDIQNTVSIGRVFDFEITDCLDVNFKDVFRYLNADDNTVNALTGTRYFSGIRRLLATDSITTNDTNILVNRNNLVVGSVTKILPLGPYKHTTNTYIQSVKLGYRFSFDLKTSGYYSPKADSDVERSVRITPSYYYISKDGQTFNDNIKVYYKNSAGKYTNFETSNYTIYYKPDDGYRNLYNSSTYSETDVSKVSKDGITTLTNSLVGLNIGSTSGFTLSSKKSMTSSDGGYLQAWYGEYKVPNSAIALAVDASGNVDINSPLSNGYIGVKFKIECIDKYKNRADDVIISYDANDTGLGNNAPNTSQWDYEGYLGLNTYGQKLSKDIKIQLENGVWNINDDMYNKIKGTVILYDLDNKASNDYN